MVRPPRGSRVREPSDDGASVADGDACRPGGPVADGDLVADPAPFELGSDGVLAVPVPQAAIRPQLTIPATIDHSPRTRIPGTIDTAGFHDGNRHAHLPVTIWTRFLNPADRRAARTTRLWCGRKLGSHASGHARTYHLRIALRDVVRWGTGPAACRPDPRAATGRSCLGTPPR